MIAVGGNALIARGEVLSAENQRRNVAAAAPGLAHIIAQHDVVVVHGNGPQIGLLVLEAAAYKAVAAYPLDILGAESQGLIGYLIAQALANENPTKHIAALITQTLVDPHDHAFQNPTKPIGPIYRAADSHTWAAANGWVMRPDGDGVRRVVASPEPLEIIETGAINCWLSQGIVPICAGGGGIPVQRNNHGLITGIEAVIDKDLAAALLAHELHADLLVILMDADAIYRDWGTPTQQALHQATPAALRAMQFAPGSMAPKIEALCRFVEGGGPAACVGALSHAGAVLAGTAGG